jgi:lactoylglutathione lyase
LAALPVHVCANPTRFTGYDICDEPCLNGDELSEMPTKYLHSMIRVTDPDATVAFFALIGLKEVRRFDSEAGRFTLIFLAAEGQEGLAEVELTYNWPPEDGEAESYDGGRNFGHLAYRVDNIYATCQRLMDAGVTINRPPRDGHMAFVKSPDGISVELLQEGRLEPAEPWASMPNVGSW